MPIVIVKPRESGSAGRYVLSSGFSRTPRFYRNTKISNVGRVEVDAKSKFDSYAKSGQITEGKIRPGETVVLQDSGDYFLFYVEVYNNNTDERAIICISSENNTCDNLAVVGEARSPFNFKIDYNLLLKTSATTIAGYIPTIGGVLEGLITYFWPENEPNVWEEIKSKVETLVDDKILQAVQGILLSKMNSIGSRIITLSSSMKKNLHQSDEYMNIAGDLVGVEQTFQFGPPHPDYKKINFMILPLYSAVISMKMSYYSFGMKQAQNIGLSDEQVSQLRTWEGELLNKSKPPFVGVKKYIKDMYDERVTDAYNNGDPQDIFNEMMNVRTHVALYGLEHIPVWDSILKNQTADGVHNDVISYSNSYQHGRISVNLFREATPRELSQPLTPKLINGKRNRLVSIELYSIKRPTEKIGGMKLTFENGDTYVMGTATDLTKKINLQGVRITELEVGGSGAVDFLNFHLSDGNIIGHGTLSPKRQTFKMPQHYIASIFLTSDATDLDGLATNIAVSYQPNEACAKKCELKVNESNTAEEAVVNAITYKNCLGDYKRMCP